MAGAAALAADVRLRQLADDPTLGYCFWLLTRIAWASRSADFAGDLADLGLTLSPDGSALAFTAQLADHVRTVTAADTGSGHFAELAALALRRSLTETVGQQGRSFLGSSVEDLRLAFRAYATKERFGALAHRFFGDFLARSLSSFLDRALSHHVGPGAALANIGQSAEFMQALDTFSRESARSVESFAAGWYSKHDWEAAGRISRSESQGFLAVALRKLRAELRQQLPDRARPRGGTTPS